MRLNVVRSKNAVSLYVIRSQRINKQNKTFIVEKLGTEAELREKLNGRDPYEWAKEYIAELNRREKEGSEPDVIAKYSPAKQLTKDVSPSHFTGHQVVRFEPLKRIETTDIFRILRYSYSRSITRKRIAPRPLGRPQKPEVETSSAMWSSKNSRPCKG